MRAEPASSHGNHSMSQNNVLVAAWPNQSALKLACLGADLTWANIRALVHVQHLVLLALVELGQPQQLEHSLVHPRQQG